MVGELHTQLACPPEICGGLLGPWLGGEVSHAASHAATGAATSVFGAFANWVVSGAVWLVSRAIALVQGSTSIDIHAGWFARREAAMVKVALLVVLPMVAAGTIGAVLRQDGKRLARIYGVGVPVAVLVGAAAVTLTQLALAVVDGLCRLITAKKAYAPYSNIDGDMSHHGMPLVVQLIVGSVMVIAALALWLELILRSVVIDIAVFFFPLGMAAVVWPTTAHIAKRFVEILVAIIGSKFVIVATLTLGAAMVEQPAAGVDDAVKAAAILLLAAFAPFALLRLVPIVEIAAVGQLEGLSRRPVHAGAGVASMAVGGSKGAVGLLLGGSSGDKTSTDAVGAVGIAPRSGDLAVGSLGSLGGASGGSSSGSGPGATGGSGGGGSGGGGGGGGTGGGGGYGSGPPESSPRPESRQQTSPQPATPQPTGSEPARSEPARSEPARAQPAAPTMPDPADLAGPLPVLERSLAAPPPGDTTRADD